MKPAISYVNQSELPLCQFLEILWNQTKDIASRIYFDNVGDNMMLTLYNVTLTSQKPC